MKCCRMLRLWFIGTLLGLISLSTAQDRLSPPASAPANQNKEPQASSPFIRSTTNLVLVDVVVSHDGHPIKGLQQQAFHIFENGREQNLKLFEEHSPSDAVKTEQPALPPGTYSNVPESTGSAINVLLLDAVNT